MSLCRFLGCPDVADVLRTVHRPPELSKRCKKSSFSGYPSHCAGFFSPHQVASSRARYRFTVRSTRVPTVCLEIPDPQPASRLLLRPRRATCRWWRPGVDDRPPSSGGEWGARNSLSLTSRRGRALQQRREIRAQE